MNARYARIRVADVCEGDRIRRRQNSGVGRVYRARNDPYYPGKLQISLAIGSVDEIFRAEPSSWVWIEVPRP